jgi:hypothetical protein
MFLPAHVIAVSSIAMHLEEICLKYLGLVHKLEPILPSLHIEKLRQYHISENQFNVTILPDI